MTIDEQLRSAGVGGILCVSALGLTTPFQVDGQEPPPFGCQPAAFENVDALIGRLDSIAAGASTFGTPTQWTATVNTLVSTFPVEEVPCPRLAPDVDRREAMITVLEYARDHDDSRMAGRVMRPAGSLAYRLGSEWGWDPTDFLFDAVIEGRTEGARVGALLRLMRQATDPAIRARLLALARRPEGPASWPDLPLDLIQDASFTPGPGPRLLLEEIEEAPGLIAHPRARWRVECGFGHAIPRSADHPCNPVNAPPRIDPGGG